MDNIYLNLFETDNQKIISIKIYDFINHDAYAYGYSVFDFIKKKKITLKDHLYHNFLQFNHKENINNSLIINRDVMIEIISYNVYDIFDMSKKEFFQNFEIIEFII